MKLYDLQLQGVCTYEIESLPSFLIRLASLHCVSTRKLIIKLYKYNASHNENADYKESTIYHIPSVNTLVRPNKLTESIVSALQMVVDEPYVTSGTFLAIKDCLARSMSLYEKDLKWCPQCFYEAVSLGIEPYYRLYWSLSSVKTCWTHGIELRDRCICCRKKQNTNKERDSLSQCIHCKSDLYFKSYSPKKISHEDDDIKDLVVDISQNPELTYPRDSTKILLKEIFQNVWENDQDYEFWKKFPRDETLGLIQSNKPITLLNARRFAIRLGIDLTSLFRGDLIGQSYNLDSGWQDYLPKSIRPRKRRKMIDREIILHELKKILKNKKEYEQRSLKSIAQELGVSADYLSTYFRQSAQIIKLNHKNWLERQRMEKWQKARLMAMEYFSESGLSGTNKGALRYIRENSELPKNLVREAIKSVNLHA